MFINRFSFAKGQRCCNCFFTDTKGVKKLERQLLAFKKIKKDRAYGLSSVMFSGKGSGNDDLAMAMLIGTHFSNKFTKKELSVNYRSMGL